MKYYPVCYPKIIERRKIPVNSGIFRYGLENMKLGIVGLPNVGKSTLFNAITNTSIAALKRFEPNITKYRDTFWYPSDFEFHSAVHCAALE